MALTTLSSRKFGKHVSRAKKAAKAGPVFITERGKPAYVLLTLESYEQLGANTPPLAAKSSPRSSSKMSIVDIFGMPPGIEDAELEIPRDNSLARSADFD